MLSLTTGELSGLPFFLEVIVNRNSGLDYLCAAVVNIVDVNVRALQINVSIRVIP
jgi:hypothetical protein